MIFLRRICKRKEDKKSCFDAEYEKWMCEKIDNQLFKEQA